MGFDSMDRKSFLGVAGGALLCTIGGKQYKVDSETDLAELSS